MAVLSADGALLLLSLFLTAVNFALRIERWRLLLKPVVFPSFGSAARATVIGFTANTLLPGRVGELIRPYMLSRREAISGPEAFATIVLERLFDLMAIALLVAFFVVLSDLPLVSTSFLSLLKAGTLLSVVVGSFGIGVIVAIASNALRTNDLARRFGRVVPVRFRPAAVFALERFILGLAALKRPGLLAWTLLLSAILWLIIALSIWATVEAFGLKISFNGVILLMGLVALGVAVPTPAGVGGYHAAFQFGLTALYAGANDQAVGAALVMHAISFGPITALGLLFMVQEGMNLRTISSCVAKEDKEVFR